MYNKNLEEFIDKLYTDLRNDEDSEFKDYVRKIDTNLGPDNERMLRRFLTLTASAAMVHEANDKDFHEILKHVIKKYCEDIPKVLRLFEVEVSLRECREEVNRVIRFPADIKVSALCYLVMAVFGCTDGHLFVLEKGSRKFYTPFYNDYGDYDEGEKPEADLYNVSDLNLRRGSHLILTYDFGDNWSFDIKVLSSKRIKRLPRDTDYQVISGKGSNIWENDHYYYDLYYHDPKAFEKEMDEMGINTPDLIAENAFDLAKTNENLLEDFYNLETAYESDNPDFYDDNKTDNYSPVN